MDRLEPALLNKICHYLSPPDRLSFQNTCKKTREAVDIWDDSVIVEIRDDEDAPRNAYAPTCSYTKPDNDWYIVKVTVRTGDRHSFKAPKNRNSIRAVKNLLMRNREALYLRIWNTVLSDEFVPVLSQYSKIKSLKMWNCGNYFEKKTNMKRVIYSLLGHPKITELLILDSTETGAHHSMCTAMMDCDLVKLIKAPIVNLQMAGVHLPWRSFTMLCQHIGPTCERLSIGCIHGKEIRREKYVAALERLEIVSDLDLPPFIFYLNDRVPSIITQSLDHIFEKLPLISLGVRHYNTATLFQYIEDILPLKIKMLRIHHNATRLPNFAQLGNHNFEEPRKKISMISRHSYLSSSSCEYPHEGPCEDHHSLHRTSSFIFPSSSFGQKTRRHRGGESARAYDSSRKSSAVSTASNTTGASTIKAATAGPGPSSLRREKSQLYLPRMEPPTPMMPKKEKSKIRLSKKMRSSGSSSSSGSNGSIFGGRFQFLMRKSNQQEQQVVAPTVTVNPGDRPALHERDLTIFTVEERGNRTELKIRQKMFAGVSVVFTRECATVQEVLGRMGSPLKSPHVYSKNANREIRIVKGDLVKPIPLTSLGMESDYDASDFEGDPPEVEKPLVPYEFEFERDLRMEQRDMSKFRGFDFSRPLAISSF